MTAELIFDSPLFKDRGRIYAALLVLISSYPDLVPEDIALPRYVEALSIFSPEQVETIVSAWGNTALSRGLPGVTTLVQVGQDWLFGEDEAIV